MNIAIIENSNQQWINLRDLHNELEIKRDYTNWSKDQIQRGGFVEGEDWNKVKPDEVYALDLGSGVGFNPDCEKSKVRYNDGSKGGRPSVIYIVTIDTAKHIAMMSNVPKGRQARNYFIEVEKQYKNPQLSNTQLLAKAFIIAGDMVNKMNADNQKNKSKVEFYDRVASSKDLLTMKETADLIGIGRNDLFKLLRDKEYLITGGKNHNLSFRKYINQGLFEPKITTYRKGYTDKTTTITMVTPKGLEYLTKLVKND